MMMSGTIIGESSKAVMVRLNGMSELASPTAAIVPRIVATTVAKMPTMKLFCIASIQLGVSRIVTYQRSE